MTLYIVVPDYVVLLLSLLYIVMLLSLLHIMLSLWLSCYISGRGYVSSKAPGVHYISNILCNCSDTVRIIPEDSENLKDIACVYICDMENGILLTDVWSNMLPLN